ncbi:MAG: helix-turn-helix transcriptional regulator, partial [Lachnospiraceae bacterium]|nr:helix-turn-helix transcriptional regulator [Lachnospiraceae bacterium]
MNIGDKIKNAREENNLTQSQAAESLMVSRQTISNWETGKSLPDILSVIRMSELYQISLDELLKGDKAMMAQIEKDIEIRKTEKNIIKYAWISILAGVIILTLGNIFEGNPVIEFLSGATPWILLGFTFLFWILSLNKQN